MRYRLENNAPVLIKKVVVDGKTITNPSDSFIDEHGLGYPIDDTDPPIYYPETEKISFEWVVRYGVLTKEWTVSDLSAEEMVAKHNAEIDARIREVNSGYEEYKTTPIHYVFGDKVMWLKPIWVTEYYGTLMQIGLMSNGANFPTTITDANCEDFEMTFEQFSTMYLWLVQQAQSEIKRVNAALAELQAQKEEVVNG